MTRITRVSSFWIRRSAALRDRRSGPRRPRRRRHRFAGRSPTNRGIRSRPPRSRPRRWPAGISTWRTAGSGRIVPAGRSHAGGLPDRRHGSVVQGQRQGDHAARRPDHRHQLSHAARSGADGVDHRRRRSGRRDADAGAGHERHSAADREPAAERPQLPQLCGPRARRPSGDGRVPKGGRGPERRPRRRRTSSSTA